MNHNAATARPAVKQTLRQITAALVRLYRHLARRTPTTLVVPAASYGSVGDLAMIEAFVAHARPARYTIASVDRDDGWRRVQPADRLRIDLAPLCERRSFRKDIALLLALRHVDQVVITGADVMDGAYTRNGSIARWHLLELGHLAGCRCAVTGFSFNDHPHPDVLAVARQTQGSALLFSRDPVSGERLAASGIAARPAADLAFSLPPGEPDLPGDLSDWLDEQRRAGRDVVGININHHTLPAGRSPGALIDLYADLAGWLIRDRGLAVLLIPHDDRGDNSDLVLLEMLHRRLRDDAALAPHVHNVAQLPSPRQVMAIGARLCCAVSGRMHLSILTMAQGTPAVTLSYQGKTEGLYQLLHCPELGVEPVRFFAGEARDVVAQLLDKEQELRARLQRHLPEVKRLSRAQAEALSLVGPA